MTLERATAHGPRPFDCTGRELKCEAVTNAVVTSRRRSEIPLTISGVCQFAESECQNNSVPIYLVGAGRSGVLCRDGWMYFLDQIHEVSIPNNVSELCDRCFKECKSLRRVTFGSSSSLERIGVSCFAETGSETLTSYRDSFHKGSTLQSETHFHIPDKCFHRIVRSLQQPFYTFSVTFPITVSEYAKTDCCCRAENNASEQF